MRNVRIVIQYDGTAYHGWQKQPCGPTIQGVLTDVLARLDGQPVIVHGAGRTDAGVHALGQVANFFFRREMTEWELLKALNGNLPPDIRVVDVQFAHPHFHARRHARSKTYRYAFFLGEVVSPFLYRYVYHCRYRLDLERLQQAAELFKGEHDFAGFATQPQTSSSTIRRITDVKLVHQNEFLHVYITADGFLRSMARRIAGTLQEVGRGKMSLDDVRRRLCGDHHGPEGPSLPAKGLTLIRVDY